jgi:uncharacterized phage infection (PIP) family protein YhgE
MNMKKILILFCITLLMLTSFGSYYILSEKIIAGNLKIAEGQKQLAEGEKLLAQGKARYSAGKQKLSSAKQADKGFRLLPIVGVVALPIGVGAELVAHQKIADGSRKLAAGKQKIRAGEKQLAEGKFELGQGQEKLNFANKVRIACGIGALFFAFLLIGLGGYWARTLIKAKK